jgi:hypothetical protein
VIIEKLHLDQVSEPWRDGLPPPKCWAKDPRDRMASPRDDRGLVDEAALIRGVCSYIKPAFLWPDNLSSHHKYWEGAWYSAREEATEGRVPASQFRELPPNRILMPRMFHTVLHVVTRAPRMPDPDVMRWQIASWRVASNLFGMVCKNEKTARRVAKEMERPNTADREEILLKYQHEQFKHNFKGINMHLDALGGIPEEHWMINPNDPPIQIMRQIGEVLNKSYLRMGGRVTYTSRGRRRISLGHLLEGQAAA